MIALQCKCTIAEKGKLPVSKNLIRNYTFMYVYQFAKSLLVFNKTSFCVSKVIKIEKVIVKVPIGIY